MSGEPVSSSHLLESLDLGVHVFEEMLKDKNEKANLP